MSGGGGGGSNSMTQSTKVELPSWAQGYAQNTLGNVYNWASQPYQQYPGQQIASLNQYQTQALKNTANLGGANPNTQAANGLLQNTLNGQYLDITNNPAWESAKNDITSAYQTGIAPQTDAAFARAGAYGMGNSAYDQTVQQNQTSFGKALASAAGDIYKSERNNQMQALSMAPALNANTYSDYQHQIGAGDAVRQYQQDLLNQNLQNWTEAKNYPYTQAQGFANLFPALMGNSGVTTATGPNPYKASPMAGALGGATLGYGLGTAGGALLGAEMAPYAPWIGAAVGALGGYAMSN